MPEWFLARHLALSPRRRGSAADRRRRSSSSSREALAQPAVFVHRDYHSRNLMRVPRAQPRRHRLPGRAARPGRLRPGVAAEGLLHRLAARARSAAGCTPIARALQRPGRPGRRAVTPQFLRWFDLIGVQRHVKVLGIFCRLWYRDGKSGYLADLPRTLDYVRDTCTRYPELQDFSALSRGARGARRCRAPTRAVAPAGRSPGAPA